MTIFDIGIRLVLGLVIGFCIGLTGVGGGVLVLPAMTVVLGLPPSVAVGTASLYAFITKIAASYSHHRLGNVYWRAVGLTLVGAVPACLGVSWWVNWMLGRLKGNAEASEAFQAGQGVLLSVVVLAAAAYMIVQEVRHRLRPRDPADAAVDEELMVVPVAAHCGNPVLAICGGLLIGGLIGSTSVGGGVILVPLLFAIFRTTPRQTVGTSIVIALALTLVTAFVYGKGGQLDISTGLIMGVAAFAGARLGAKFTTKMPHDLLRMILAAIVVFSGGLMLAKMVWGG